MTSMDVSYSKKHTILLKLPETSYGCEKFALRAVHMSFKNSQILDSNVARNFNFCSKTSLGTTSKLTLALIFGLSIKNYETILL